MGDRRPPGREAGRDPEGAEDRRLAVANLRRWLRRQLREPSPWRERLEAAVANEDPDEVRRLLERSPFFDAQRRYLEDLLARWEDEIGARS